MDFTLDQVQEATGQTYNRLYWAIRQGKLAAQKREGQWRISAEALDKLKRELATPAVDALVTKLGEAVVGQVQEYHKLGVARKAILNALRADISEAEQYEPPEYAVVLRQIVEMLPTSQYIWTGDSWRVTLADGSSVESRSVSGPEPVELVNTGTNGKG